MRLERPPQIGDWYAMCCWRDINQITEQAELDEFAAEPVGYVEGFWATEYDALADLVRDGVASGDTFESLDRFYPAIASDVRSILAANGAAANERSTEPPMTR